MKGHLVVELAGARRTIAIGAVQEIVRTGAIARVPGAPPAMRGLSAVRGRLVPVVDPADVPAATAGFLVIVTIDGRGVGLLVERIAGVVDDGDDVPPPIDLGGYGRSAA